MEYPVELLPNPAYKTIDCDLSNRYLLRFIPTANLSEILDKETGTIKLDCVCSPSARVSDLSMSLLGVYQVKHIFIQLTDEGADKYNSECAPDDAVEIPFYERHYRLNHDRHFWYIQHVHLANKIFEFQSSNETLRAKCLVLHTPMCWNFWHFSLRWELEDGLLEDLDQKQRDKLARKLGHAVKSMIVKFASIEEPQHEPLPRNCYCKN